MTGLAGQWMARYSGSNAGVMSVDIDDIGNCYRGAACVWDDDANLPNSYVRFFTMTKDNAQSLQNIPISFLDNAGSFLSDETKATLLAAGVVLPQTVNITLKLRAKALDVSWVTSIGTNGTAALQRSAGPLPSLVKALPISTWDDFKTHVGVLDPKNFVFRGQESSKWRLRASFFRHNRANLDRYLSDDIADLQRIFSGMTPYPLNLSDSLHYGAFINLAQHHGYPTPMLDWTWSPYVAAFFAFRNVKPVSTRDKDSMVRIYQFHSSEWIKRIPQFGKFYPAQPHVSMLSPLAFGNSRVVPQQSISMITNIDDIESHIMSIETATSVKFVEAIDIPASDRDKVMRDLALMGITAASLFPGLDGACEMLKERNF